MSLIILTEKSCFLAYVCLCEYHIMSVKSKHSFMESILSCPPHLSPRDQT